MKDATKLRELSSAIEGALAAQDLPLAHRLVDERLAFLQSLCAIGQFSQELVLAAKAVLALDGKLCVVLEMEKCDLQQRLRDVMVADKGTQMYKAHSR